MKDNEECVSLDTIAGGAAVELFGAELLNVLRNVADLNTSATAKREIVLKFSISPTEDRDLGTVTVQCNSKLAGIKPLRTVLYLGRIDNQLVAVEQNPKQAGLFDKKGPVVVPLSGKKE